MKLNTSFKHSVFMQAAALLSLPFCFMANAHDMLPAKAQS